MSFCRGDYRVGEDPEGFRGILPKSFSSGSWNSKGISVGENRRGAFFFIRERDTQDDERDLRKIYREKLLRGGEKLTKKYRTTESFRREKPGDGEV